MDMNVHLSLKSKLNFISSERKINHQMEMNNGRKTIKESKHVIV